MSTSERHVLQVVEDVWIAASPARVFRAFTDPQELTTWWRIPDQYSTDEAEVELRVGGRYRLAGRSRGGGTFSVSGTYAVVDPPHRLAYTWVPDWDPDAAESRVEIRLDEESGGTRVRVAHTGFLSERSRGDHASGWPSVLTALGGHIEGDGGGA